MHMPTHQLFSIRVEGGLSLSLVENMFHLVMSQDKEKGRKDRKRIDGRIPLSLPTNQFSFSMEELVQSRRL